MCMYFYVCAMYKVLALFLRFYTCTCVRTAVVSSYGLSYLVVLQNAPVQVGISELPLSLVARVAAYQGGPVHKQEVAHDVFSLPSGIFCDLHEKERRSIVDG